MKQDTSAFVADRGLIQTLEKRSQPIPCGEDLVLFRQGEAPKGLYILRSGEASLLMRSKSGEEAMRLRAGAGSLIGLPAVIGNKPYTLTATARKGSEIKFVSRADYEDLTRTEPSLCFKVLEVLAAEVRAARNALLGS
jgi:CRP-like cAMP-binding protein